MKKNKMMRLASFLLVAVLLTSSIISGTFAKYVTEGEMTDSARVAKFGVEISAAGNLFADAYVDYSSGDMPGASNATVISASGDDVVAPGTQNDAALSFGITGTPEVRVQITITPELVKNVYLVSGRYSDVTTADAEDKFDLDEDYYPIEWSIKQNGVLLFEYGSFDNIISYFNSLNNSLTFAPNTDLSNVTELSGYTLCWKWAFDGNDKADTVLGDLAAGNPDVLFGKANPRNPKSGTHYSTEIEVKFTITVTQVD